MVLSRGGRAKQVFGKRPTPAQTARCACRCSPRRASPMPSRTHWPSAHSARWLGLGCAREAWGRQGDGTGGRKSGWPESEGGERIGGRHGNCHGEGRSRSAVVGSQRAWNGDGVVDNDFGVVGSRRWVWRRYGVMSVAGETRFRGVVHTAHIAYIYCMSKNARNARGGPDDDGNRSANGSGRFVRNAGSPRRAWRKCSDSTTGRRSQR